MRSDEANRFNVLRDDEYSVRSSSCFRRSGARNSLQPTRSDISLRQRMTARSFFTFQMGTNAAGGAVTGQAVAAVWGKRLFDSAGSAGAEHRRVRDTDPGAADRISPSVSAAATWSGSDLVLLIYFACLGIDFFLWRYL